MTATVHAVMKQEMKSVRQHQQSLKNSLMQFKTSLNKASLTSTATATHKLYQLITEEKWMEASTNLQHYPEQAKKKYKTCVDDGNTFVDLYPLHHALALTPPPDIIGELLTYYPSAARRTEKCFNRLPIHIACVSGASAVVVQLLLRSYPDGAKCKAVYGRLPLHYACTCISSDSKDILMCLLDAYPDAAKIRDDYGWLPLHVACVYNAPLNFIKAMVQAYPEAVFLKTTKGKLAVDLCSTTRKNRRGKEVHSFLQRYMKTKSRTV